MTRTRWFIGTAAALALLLVAGATALFAAGPQRTRGFGAGPGMPPLPVLAAALDLTDAQQQQIKAVFDTHRPEFAQIAERRRAAQQQVRTTVEANEMNEQAIRSAVSALSQVQADGAVLRARVRQEVLATLTPEQRAKADQLRHAMHERRGRRFGGAQHNRGM